MREIQLTRGKIALVDDEDLETISEFKWYAHPSNYTFYAVRSAWIRGIGSTNESMHRVILARKLGRGLLKSEEADHENGDGLDNRRENLRPATHAQNHRNCYQRKPNRSSQYLGLTWHNLRKNWQVQIKVYGKTIFLGRYATELEAALAREYYIASHPELMARSNLPAMEGIPC